MKKNSSTDKTADLPPTGNRNADPITDAPGAHPIETGVGAALGGAAAGMAAGAVGGPVGAVIGAVAGAVAGGYGGKGVGEAIDPTTDDSYYRDTFESKSYRQKDRSFDDYRPAYSYGATARSSYGERSFDEVESDLRSNWDTTHKSTTGLAWDHARDAVRDAYDRTIQLREEHLKVNKEQVKTGDVSVRKEVVTEHKVIEVPVEREEVVIERRSVNKAGVAGDIKAEEIRIPVKEEHVHVSKESVVTEEVSVGKRKVQDVERVSGDVRKEELHVENQGSATVRDSRSSKNS